MTVIWYCFLKHSAEDIVLKCFFRCTKTLPRLDLHSERVKDYARNQLGHYVDIMASNLVLFSLLLGLSQVFAIPANPSEIQSSICWKCVGCPANSRKILIKDSLYHIVYLQVAKAFSNFSAMIVFKRNCYKLTLLLILCWRCTRNSFAKWYLVHKIKQRLR